MLCEFKLRSQNGDGDLQTAHVMKKEMLPTNVADFCTTIPTPTYIKKPHQQHSSKSCTSSSQCNNNQYCDNVEQIGDLHINSTFGTCKHKLPENRNCASNEMCKEGLECKLPRMETQKICSMKPSIGLNYDHGSDISS